MISLRGYRKSELVVRLFLSAIFVSAGVAKLFDFSGFMRALLTYSIIPYEAARWSALPIILIEIWIGVALIVPSWQKDAALAGMILMGGFLSLVGLEYLGGSTGPCGCNGLLLSGKKDLVHVLQNLILLLLLFLVHEEKLGKGGE